MTVQELIDELNKIEDKTRIIKCTVDHLNRDIKYVWEGMSQFVYLEIRNKNNV